MSVTKSGPDDGNCGVTNNDILHQAICRRRRRRDHGRRRRGQRQPRASTTVPARYNEVITVSALADTDGKAGGLGGNRCFSWGGYDKDDTFADFSNYGCGRRPHRPRQVHLVHDPGPGYAYLSGHVHGRPDGHRRRRALQGQPAEGDAGRGPRGPSLSRQPRSGRPRPIRTRPTSRCSTSRASGRSGRSTSDARSVAPVGRGRSTTRVDPVHRRIAARPSSSVSVCRSRRVPAGWTAGPTTTSLFGWNTTTGGVSVTSPQGPRSARYHSACAARTRVGARPRPSMSTSSTTTRRPRHRAASSAHDPTRHDDHPDHGQLAGRDRSHECDRPLRSPGEQGRWRLGPHASPAVPTAGAARLQPRVQRSLRLPRPGTRRGRQLESVGRRPGDADRPCR